MSYAYIDVYRCVLSKDHCVTSVLEMEPVHFSKLVVSNLFGQKDTAVTVAWFADWACNTDSKW